MKVEKNRREVEKIMIMESRWEIDLPHNVSNVSHHNKCRMIAG